MTIHRFAVLIQHFFCVCVYIYIYIYFHYISMILWFQAIRLWTGCMESWKYEISVTCHSSIINLPGRSLHMLCFLLSIYHPALFSKLLLLPVLPAVLLLQMVSQQREPSPLPRLLEAAGPLQKLLWCVL